MSALADAAAELLIVSPLTEGVLDMVNAADDWLELARKTVAKRNSGQKLGKCLGWMLSSLDRALEQFTLRLQVRPCSLDLYLICFTLSCRPMVGRCYS